MPPKDGDSTKSTIDPLSKPKPGQKPKPAYPGSNYMQVRQTAGSVQAQPKRTVVPEPHEQKLILCRYYEQGLCERGSACWFAHGKDELRHPQKHAVRQEAQKQPLSMGSDNQEQCPDEALFKTKMCVYFQQGRCQRGSSCSFAHDPAELQSFDRARRSNNPQASNARPLTLDQYLPDQLTSKTSSSTGSPDKPVLSVTTPAAVATAFAAPPRGNAQPLGPKIATPRSYVTPLPPSPAASNSSTAAQNGNIAKPSNATTTGKDADASKAANAGTATNTGNAANMGQAATDSSAVQTGDAASPGNGAVATKISVAVNKELNGHSNGDVAHVEKSFGELNFGDGDDELEAPPSFCCPITTELLLDPVVAADGHTYERHDISEWLLKNETSPMTNERMEHKHLIPNLALRAVMDLYFGIRA